MRFFAALSLLAVCLADATNNSSGDALINVKASLLSLFGLFEDK